MMMMLMSIHWVTNGIEFSSCNDQPINIHQKKEAKTRMNQTKFNKNAVSHTSNATKIDEREKKNLIVTITRKKHQKKRRKK